MNKEEKEALKAKRACSCGIRSLYPENHARGCPYGELTEQEMKELFDISFQTV